MQSLPSRCVFSLKHTSKHITFYRYCMVLPINLKYANNDSAELEMTVNMLIQIDKLVQLLESPVFTCTILIYTTKALLTGQ